MASLNPLKYRPAQIAKALVAVLTGAVGLLGLVAGTFADGPLATLGQWAVAAMLVLTPILVFLKKAEPLMGLIEGAVPKLTGESE